MGVRARRLAIGRGLLGVRARGVAIRVSVPAWLAVGVLPVTFLPVAALPVVRRGRHLGAIGRREPGRFKAGRRAATRPSGLRPSGFRLAGFGLAGFRTRTGLVRHWFPLGILVPAYPRPQRAPRPC